MQHANTFSMRSSATTGLFYRDLGARWLHDDSRWRPSKEKNDQKRGWRISAGRAPQYLSGLERAGNAVAPSRPARRRGVAPPVLRGADPRSRPGRVSCSYPYAHTARPCHHLTQRPNTSHMRPAPDGPFSPCRCPPNPNGTAFFTPTPCNHMRAGLSTVHVPPLVSHRLAQSVCSEPPDGTTWVTNDGGGSSLPRRCP